MNDLTLPEELKHEVTTLEEMTRTVAVRSSSERADVYKFVQAVKTKKKAIVEYFADMKESAHSAWKKIVAAEKTETDKLDAFEAAAKRAILGYDQAEAAKAEAERKRLQAIADEQARKEREKFGQEMARQRAIEEEERRKAEEARRAAQAAKDAAERQRLQAEAEAAERKAASAQVKAEAKQEAAAAVVAPVVQVAPVERQEGESKRVFWKARIENVAKIPGNYYLQNPKVVEAIQAALDKFAQATKGAVQVEGVKFYSEQSLTIKR